MRIRDFLKQLNSKQNIDGSLTYDLVEEILGGEEKTIQIFKKRNSCVKYVENNFLKILNKTNKSDKFRLVVLFFSDNDLKEIIEKNFIGILQEFNSNKDTQEYIKMFLKIFFDSSAEKKKFIQENIEEIIQNIDKSCLFDTAKILKCTSEDIKNRLNREIEDNKFLISKEMILKALPNDTFINGVADKSDLNDYSKTLSIIIDELLESENLSWVDITAIGKGGFCTVYKLGDKVLKVGEPRVSYKIPNHERIVQPILRTNLTGKNSQKPFCCLEISDYLRTYFKSTEKNDLNLLYTVYKELRDAGIKWTDVKWDNVGRLIRPNTPTLNGKEIYINPNSVGFDKQNDKTLGKGNIVIIDSDFIYNFDEDSEKIYYGSINMYDDFENRYRKERMWEDSACLTRKRMKNLILEYKTSKNEYEIGVLMSEFARMTDEEFKKFLNENIMVVDVQKYLDQRIECISKNKGVPISNKENREY